MQKSLPSLLLLPPPPVPVSQASIVAAYRPAITASISALKGHTTSTELLVVLPCPSVHGRLHVPRSQIYGEVQKLLGELYSLISLVCGNLLVEVDPGCPGAVDARVILLEYDPVQTFSAESNYSLNTVVGPIIDLPTLALTRRQWDQIFSVDGEEAQKILASYTNIANSTTPPLYGQFQLVSGGVSLVYKTAETVNTSLTTSVYHDAVIVGGTFDHLHAGHKLLLTATALLVQSADNKPTTPRRLIVGITGDKLLKDKKYAQFLKSWRERQKDVTDFLLSILSFTSCSLEAAIQTSSLDEPVPNGRAVHTRLKASSITIECVEIQDPFGPTITDENISALVVSRETRSGGQAVNEKRVEKGWRPLEVFEIDVLESEESDGKTGEFASKISSTAIRKHKADLTRASSTL